jgi:hypothetical protein
VDLGASGTSAGPGYPLQFLSPPEEPVVLVDFLHKHAKNPRLMGSLGSLHGIKMHNSAFLFNMCAEAQQAPSKMAEEI